MKDFVLKLLSEEEFIHEDYTKYSEKGGVVGISLYSPCELLKKLLKFYHCNNEKGIVKENLIISLHKFMLMKHVCSQLGNPYNYYDASQVLILLSKSEVSFDWKSTIVYKISDFRHSKRMNIGNAFLSMLNNFKQLTSNRKLPKYVSLSFNNEIVISFNETLQNAEPEEGWENIFKDCSSPPYGMQDASKETQNLIEYLYGNNSEHYSWNHYLQNGDETWSRYWCTGMEFWGCHAMTSYNYDKEVFIVASASTSD
ncbi:predicted protein [Naegleria gruberi]|uniref:Predicted protein n=1 Tax=Naegleria gruberi TaxID=5762 RepID=D2W1J0_NAEGR|nr:uncharacterized protein NAEGRDRAFT_75238 [Naegleria gruberi]EFC37099.1 predicted protein [Naegleria gruberi]|eukprot:XP_002669843.1 predicted protein [Naegleria gruberi strain NEG-M]